MPSKPSKLNATQTALLADFIAWQGRGVQSQNVLENPKVRGGRVVVLRLDGPLRDGAIHILGKGAQWLGSERDRIGVQLSRTLQLSILT